MGDARGAPGRAERARPTGGVSHSPWYDAPMWASLLVVVVMSAVGDEALSAPPVVQAAPAPSLRQVSPEVPPRERGRLRASVAASGMGGVALNQLVGGGGLTLELGSIRNDHFSTTSRWAVAPRSWRRGPSFPALPSACSVRRSRSTSAGRRGPRWPSSGALTTTCGVRARRSRSSSRPRCRSLGSAGRGPSPSSVARRSGGPGAD